MMYKKGAATQEKIVKIVLILLVLAVILSWFFGASILNWIYNLPGYSVPEGDVDISGQTDAGAVGSCKEENIIGYGINPIILNSKSTNLYLNFENIPIIKVFVSKKFLGIFNGDVQIGEFQQGKEIKIYDEIVNKGDLYKELESYLPDYKYLVNFNGAYYTKGNFICRDEVIQDVFGTKKDPYAGLVNNKEEILAKIKNKISFYFRTSGTKPEDFYFHYSFDTTAQPVENVWMYDELADSGSKNIIIFYPVDKMTFQPKNDEARDVIDLILLNSRGAS